MVAVMEENGRCSDRKLLCVYGEDLGHRESLLRIWHLIEVLGDGHVRIFVTHNEPVTLEMLDTSATSSVSFLETCGD